MLYKRISWRANKDNYAISEIFIFYVGCKCLLLKISIYLGIYPLNKANPRRFRCENDVVMRKLRGGNRVAPTINV